MNQKGFVPIVFILVILVISGLIIGGSFFIKNSGLLKNPTSSTESQQRSDNTATEIIKEKLDTKKLFTISENEKLLSGITFSPDHQHFAYIVKTSEDFSNSEYYVVRDEKEGKRYGNMVAILSYSLDSKHLAYTAGTKDKKYYAIADETKSKLYDGVYFPQFSPDGKKFAFNAKIGPIEDQKTSIVVDSVEGKYYDSIVDSFKFSPDSTHLGYEVHQKNRENFVVIDQAEGPKYDNVGNLIFSSDGKRSAYIANKDSKTFVILDGQEGNKYDGMNLLLFSPDGKQLAYRGKKLVDGQERWVLVQNGKESQPFDDVAPMAFSPDSSKLAYVVKQKGVLDAVYINDKEIAKYPFIMGGTFSPDSEKFAFIAGTQEDKSFVVVDGKELSSYSKPLFPKLVFSPNGRHVAYVVQVDKSSYVALDGKEGKIYDYVSQPSFSEDGKSLVYNAKKGQELWLIVDKIP